MNLVDIFKEYLEETIITKRKQRKKIEKLKVQLLESEEKIDNLIARVAKWTNSARELNRNYEELKTNFAHLKLESDETIKKLERKVKRLEKEKNDK